VQASSISRKDRQVSSLLWTAKAKLTVTQLVMECKSLQEALNAAAAAAASPYSTICLSTDPYGNVLSQAGPLLGQDLVGRVKGFAEQVYAVLPVLKCCGNPACGSLDKRSEVQLVGGSRGRCSLCKACCYCSKECQAAAWRLHKPVCKRLQETFSS
jgi:hypothetical protein